MKTATGPGSVYMAGGIDVVNRMKSGFPVSDVVHLGRVAGLDDIEEVEYGLRLGARVTHDQMASSPLTQARLPALAQTWPYVANIRIRCKGTIGGNVMASDPAYDFALAADTRLHFLTADDSTRTVSAAQAAGVTSDGLLTAITLPRGSALKLVFDRSLRPIVTVVLGLNLAEGRVTGGRVALGGAYATPLAASLPFPEPLSRVELAHHAEWIAQEVVTCLPTPLADHNATPAYRLRMIEVLLRRNLSA